MKSVRLHSYVVAIDDGFAPNPFYGYCTLATCKPKIRRYAKIGDWILGTGPKRKNRQGSLVYAMRVTEKMDFDSYWADPRFEDKRPSLFQSVRKSRGDNIYHTALDGNRWIQEDSCHSNQNGTPNATHIAHDTDPATMLISNDFIYHGGGPIRLIPVFNGVDVCARRGHKSKFDDIVIKAFVDWIRALGAWGYCNDPLEWT